VREFLLHTNRIFLGINIGLLVINLIAGAFVMAGVALLCGILNYQAVKQLS
jgi:polyferredoxin